MLQSACCKLRWPASCSTPGRQQAATGGGGGGRQRLACLCRWAGLLCCTCHANRPSTGLNWAAHSGCRQLVSGVPCKSSSCCSAGLIHVHYDPDAKLIHTGLPGATLAQFGRPPAQQLWHEACGGACGALFRRRRARGHQAASQDGYHPHEEGGHRRERGAGRPGAHSPAGRHVRRLSTPWRWNVAAGAPRRHACMMAAWGGARRLQHGPGDSPLAAARWQPRQGAAAAPQAPQSAAAAGGGRPLRASAVWCQPRLCAVWLP